jgi:hypothetical protein
MTFLARRRSSPLKPLLLLLALWAPAALGQTGETIILGQGALGFHEELLRSMAIKVEPAMAVDAEIFIELIGLPNVAKINALRLQVRRSPGLNTAFAYFSQNYRSIVYDPVWARSATAEFYLVLGHEAGHHICGHTIQSAHANPWQAELEADRFGGASIKRLEIYHGRRFFTDVLAAATRRYAQQGSALYPPANQRLEALRKGYEEGSPCGGLSPVEQRGYTSGPR